MQEAGGAWARASTVFELWSREGLEAMAERFWHPDIVWREPEHFPDSGVHHGRDTCVRRMSERLSLLGEVKIEVLDAREFSGRNYVEVIVRGRGTASGAPTQMHEYFVLENDGGRTTLFREFLDRDQALAAARGG